MANTVFTIGYATKPLAVFIEQLKKYEINVVADIRSVPFSKVFHDYHQPCIKSALEIKGIQYVYLGEELGPRSKDQNHYNKNNQVQFDRLMEAKRFQEGVARLMKGVDKGFKIALMCAEKSPLDCHRSLLVGYYLTRHTELSVRHIMHDGGITTQEMLEFELVQAHGLEADLFLTGDELVSLSWRKQCEQKNYRKTNN